MLTTSTMAGGSGSVRRLGTEGSSGVFGRKGIYGPVAVGSDGIRRNRDGVNWRIIIHYS